MNPDGTGNQPSDDQQGHHGQWGQSPYDAPQSGYPPQYPQSGPPQYPGEQWASPYGQEPGYAQPGYVQPGYAQPGYTQPGYAQSGYGQPTPGWGPPDVKVGTVPLRPLGLGEVYGGAVAAIRANPGVMVGFTAAAVVIMQVLTVLAQIPLTRIATGGDADSDEGVGELLAAMGASFGVSIIAAIGSLLLTAVLTVAAARSVLGDRTSSGQALRAVGPRLLPLIGLALLQALIILVPTLLVGVLVFAVAMAAGSGGPVVAVLVGLLLFLVLVVGYLAVVPAFALSNTTVVLERVGPIAALRRGFDLQRPGFWRVLGILLLSSLIVGVITIIVSIPFAVGGMIIDDGADTDNLAGATLASLAIVSIGTTISQIITAPFMAGVQALLYVDQRMRNEQFDAVLRDEAMRRWQTGAPGVPTDLLWQHKPQPAPSWY
ncbi:membrane protein [Tsukamurella pulmonis]|uniref:hypothetical protein n=1 Tax=Tsukamurella pulmonis TaxID=47312 RepID=UPI001EE00D53|nr:hypothetical protein [Tsukamurella pulmonis]BDD83339.1 membrane protein [Tsukamurella pulmonis]